MGRKSNWKTGETVAIRIPRALESHVMAYARALDDGGEVTPVVGDRQTLESDRPIAPHQLMSPINPLRVRFQGKGEPVEGLAVGVLVDWASRKVRAVLVDHEHGQTQTPIDGVEFLSPISFEKPAELVEGLAALVEAHKPEGMEREIKLFSNAPLRPGLYVDVIYGHYWNIAFQLTGHITNQGCTGIFGHANPEHHDLLLWMLLAEIQEGLRRSRGGSVHVVGSPCLEVSEKSA